MGTKQPAILHISGNRCRQIRGRGPAPKQRRIEWTPTAAAHRIAAQPGSAGRQVGGPVGWTVGGTHLTWPHADGDSGADRLPRLETDTVLRHTATGRQIVIETKFTDAPYESRFGTTKIDRNYLFQLWTYLMSQTGVGNPSADTAEAVLLFVAANGREPINDIVHMQGHRIRLLSVDLTETPDLIRRRWQLVAGSG